MTSSKATRHRTRAVKLTDRRRSRRVATIDISRRAYDGMASHEPMRRRSRGVGEDA